MKKRIFLVIVTMFLAVVMLIILACILGSLWLNRVRVTYQINDFFSSIKNKIDHGEPGKNMTSRQNADNIPVHDSVYLSSKEKSVIQILEKLYGELLKLDIPRKYIHMHSVLRNLKQSIDIYQNYFSQNRSLLLDIAKGKHTRCTPIRRLAIFILGALRNEDDLAHLAKMWYNETNNRIKADIIDSITYRGKEVKNLLVLNLLLQVYRQNFSKYKYDSGIQDVLKKGQKYLPAITDLFIQMMNDFDPIREGSKKEKYDRSFKRRYGIDGLKIAHSKKALFALIDAIKDDRFMLRATSEKIGIIYTLAERNSREALSLLLELRRNNEIKMKRIMKKPNLLKTDKEKIAELASINDTILRGLGENKCQEFAQLIDQLLIDDLKSQDILESIDFSEFNYTKTETKRLEKYLIINDIKRRVERIYDGNHMMFRTALFDTLWKEDDVYVKSYILDALTDFKFSQEDAITYGRHLLSFLKHEKHKMVLSNTLNLLGKIGGLDIIPDLLKYKGHESEKVSKAAREAIATILGEALPSKDDINFYNRFLKPLLKIKCEPYEKSAYLRFIGGLAGPDLIPELEKYLSHSSKLIRKAAKEAIEEIKSRFQKGNKKQK
jgi:HEAT repeat protein